MHIKATNYQLVCAIINRLCLDIVFRGDKINECLLRIIIIAFIVISNLIYRHGQFELNMDAVIIASKIILNGYILIGKNCVNI